MSAEWQDTGAPWTEKPLLVMVHLPPMQRVIQGMRKSALDEYAETDRL